MYLFSSFGWIGLVIEVVFIAMFFNLRGRVRGLEDAVRGGKKLEKEGEGAVPEFRHEAAPATSVRAASGPSWQADFGAWLKEDWPLKVGALLLLIGFGWVARYAFMNNWIGPMGRISLGIACGAALAAFGFYRMQKYAREGAVFLVLGVGTMISTITIARYMYDFFSPVSSLGIMFACAAVAGLASVVYRVRPLSFVFVVMAGLIPILTHAPATDRVGLFMYLMAVVLGAIWIVALTGWRELTGAGLAVVALYSAPEWGGNSAHLLPFAYAFAGIFLLTNAIGVLRAKGEAAMADAVIGGLNGLFLMTWVLSTAPNEWQSLILAAWAVVYGAAGMMLFHATRRREAFYAFAGTGAMMIAAATAAELDGATLIIAYAIEAGIVSIFSYLATREVRVAERAGLLLLFPMFLSVGSFGMHGWQSHVLNIHFFVLFVLGSVLMALGLALREFDAGGKPGESHLYNGAIVAGSIYFYGLLWNALHAGITSTDTASFIALIIYTVIGVWAYVQGKRSGTGSAYGTFLLAAVLLRLFFVEVWAMSVAGRIAMFFGVGILLMSSVFMGRKKNI